MIPTLRTQNYDLIVLSKPEIIAKTKKNAIIFLTEKNEVLLQYAKYKTINKYGVQYMTLPNKLAIICYNYYAIIRPLYFSTTITDDDLNPLPFFVTKNGKKIKKIGALFKNIMSKWANKPNVTIGDVRKSMATAIHSSFLDKTQKNHLHDSILHDEDTANNYYVQQHPKEKSNETNELWHKVRNEFEKSSKPSFENILNIEQQSSIQTSNIFLFNNDNVVVPSNSIETSYFSIQTNNVIEPMETNLVIESSIVKSYSKLIVPIHFPIKVVLEPMNQKKFHFQHNLFNHFMKKHPL